MAHTRPHRPPALQTVESEAEEGDTIDWDPDAIQVCLQRIVGCALMTPGPPPASLGSGPVPAGELASDIQVTAARPDVACNLRPQSFSEDEEDDNDTTAEQRAAGKDVQVCVIQHVCSGRLKCMLSSDQEDRTFKLAVCILLDPPRLWPELDEHARENLQCACQCSGVAVLRCGLHGTVVPRAPSGAGARTS